MIPNKVLRIFTKGKKKQLLDPAVHNVQLNVWRSRSVSGRIFEIESIVQMLNQ